MANPIFCFFVRDSPGITRVQFLGLQEGVLRSIAALLRITFVPPAWQYPACETGDPNGLARGAVPRGKTPAAERGLFSHFR